MELNEAIRRILVRHKWVLILAVVLSTVAGALVTLWLSGPTMYAATARIQAQTSAPSSDTEADAVLNRVNAIATSPDVVAAALRKAQVPQDAVRFADRNVTTSRLGSSAVITLQVTDASPGRAIVLADALAPEVVATLNRLSTEQVSTLVADLDKQRQQLAQTRALVSAQLSGAGSNDPNLVNQLATIDRSVADLVQSRQQLLLAGSAGGAAALIYTPTFTVPVSSGLMTYTALSALFGAVLGLLIAAGRETLFPSVSGAAAAARELGVPYLRSPQAANLVWSAARHDVDTVVLAGPVPRDALTALAAQLESAVLAELAKSWRGRTATVDSAAHAPAAAGGVRHRETGTPDEGAAPSTVGEPLDGSLLAPVLTVNGTPLPATSPAARVAVSVPLRISVDTTTEPLAYRAAPSGPAPGSGTAARPRVPRVRAIGALVPTASAASGLVAVIGTFAPHSALDGIHDLLQTTGWPLLGVVDLP